MPRGHQNDGEIGGTMSTLREKDKYLPSASCLLLRFGETTDKDVVEHVGGIANEEI